MKSRFLPFLFLTASSLFILNLAKAQVDEFGGPPPGVVGQQQEDIYLINLLYIPSSQQFQGKLNNGFEMFFRTDEQDYRINATPGRITRTIQHKGSRKITFFKEPFIGEDGEVVREPLMSVGLGQPGRKMIFLSRNDSGTISGNVMDIDNQKFPDNTIRVINISDQKVKARIEDTVKEVGAMAIEDFRIKNSKSRFLVPLLIAGHNGKDIYKIEDRKMAMQQGGRKMLLLYPRMNKANELAYTQFTIRPPGFVGNSSDKELKESDVDINDRRYIRSGDR